MCRGQDMARWRFNATPEPVGGTSGVQMTAPVWAATARARSPESLGLSTQKSEATALSSTTTSFNRWRARANFAWCVIQYRFGVISHEHSAALKVRHLKRMPLLVKSSPLRHQGNLAVHLLFW